MWQYNDNGSSPGIGPLVDVDMFNGTQAELEALVTKLLEILNASAERARAILPPDYLVPILE